MPEPIERALRAWSAPLLLAALFAVCSYLWDDQIKRMDRMNDQLNELTKTVTTLNALYGK